MLPIMLCVCLGGAEVADEATGVVLADDLNVRFAPSPAATVVGELRKGDRVNVRGFRPSETPGSSDRGFFEIDPPPGVVYYVAKKYVSPGGEVEGTNVRVRSAPGLQPSFIQAELPRGSAVEIVGEHDEWWKIRPTRNCRAYVSTRLVRLPEGVLVPGQPTSDGVARGRQSAGASLLEEPRAPGVDLVGAEKLSMELSSPQGKLLRAEKIAALERRRGRRGGFTGAFLLYFDIAHSEASPAADRALALQRLNELAGALQPPALARIMASGARAGKDLDSLARAFPGLSAVEGVVLRRRGEDEGEWIYGLKGGLALRGEGFDLGALAGVKSRLWGKREEAGLVVYWGTRAP